VRHRDSGHGSGVDTDCEDSRTRPMGELQEALMPPTRKPTLIAMGDPSPEDLRQKCDGEGPPTQMEDDLLRSPYKQAISLLEYLGMWASTVRTASPLCKIELTDLYSR
jgi:hypothetical protein